MSVWRATARALVELGIAAFFIAGVAWSSIGAAAPWFVLAAVALAGAIRAADVEARALFVPGGLYGSVRETLGGLAAKIAASSLLVDRLVLGPLAALVAGHYVAALAQMLFGRRVADAAVPGATFPAIVAVVLLGGVWWLQRQGRSVPDRAVSRAIGYVVAFLAIVAVWGGATVALGTHPPVLPPLPSAEPSILDVVLLVAAFGHALPALGSVDTLEHVALDLEQPRIRNLQRTARLVGAFGLLVTAPLAFLFVALVPSADASAWATAPLAGIALHLAGPSWLRVALFAAAVGAAVVFLSATVRSAASGAHGVLARLVDEGVLRAEFRKLHPRFGTPFHVIDATAAAQVGIVFLSGGQVAWLARAYAVGLIWSAVLKAAALVRFRFLRPEKRAYRVKLNLRLAGREWPLGLDDPGGVAGHGRRVPADLARPAVDRGHRPARRPHRPVDQLRARRGRRVPRRRARRWTSSSCCRRTMSICGRWTRGPGTSWCPCASRMR